MKLPSIAALVAFVTAIPLAIYSRGAADMRGRNSTLREQSQQLNQLVAENERLSKIATDEDFQPLSEAELSELLKLRDEAAQLQRSLKEMDRLRREIDRIAKAAEEQERKQQSEPHNPLLLLTEEMPLRRARLARLKAWLEDNPEQLIPELQFLSERDWVNHADWERVTDDEYMGYIGVMRANAEARFTTKAYSALKKYVAANENRFPTDLSQLQPFFESPVEEAILQRYMIVPAESLTFLHDDWTGGDWVITQRAPVNEKWDSRVAIGAKSYMTTRGKGRWDSAR